jgi:hypothetical protein
VPDFACRRGAVDVKLRDKGGYTLFQVSGGTPEERDAVIADLVCIHAALERPLVNFAEIPVDFGAQNATFGEFVPVEVWDYAGEDVVTIEIRTKITTPTRKQRRAGAVLGATVGGDAVTAKASIIRRRNAIYNTMIETRSAFFAADDHVAPGWSITYIKHDAQKWQEAWGA